MFEFKNEDAIKKSETLHSGTICTRLASSGLQDRRQADKRCVKGRVDISLALASLHPRPCFWLFRWRPLDIWFGKCVGTMNDKVTRKQILHALAASCVHSRQFFAIEIFFSNIFLGDFLFFSYCTIRKKWINIARKSWSFFLRLRSPIFEKKLISSIQVENEVSEQGLKWKGIL